MHKLLKVSSPENIFPQYKNTPIEDLINYHNFGFPFRNYEKAELLVGMCMDNRKQLNIPNNFAYILRTGGGNLRYSEFKVSYVISVGDVKAIALIGHDQCGMVNLMSRKNQFITGLMNNADWSREQAEEHFMNYAPMFEIGNEIEFLLSETSRIRQKYKKVLVAPLFYKLDDNMLYQIDENE